MIYSALLVNVNSNQGGTLIDFCLMLVKIINSTLLVCYILVSTYNCSQQQQPGVDTMFILFLVLQSLCRNESKKVMILGYLNAVLLGHIYVSIKIITVAVFSLFVFTGGTLLPEVVFVATGLYYVVRLATTLYMPYAIQRSADTLITLKRIKVCYLDVKIVILCLLSSWLIHSFFLLLISNSCIQCVPTYSSRGCCLIKFAYANMIGIIKEWKMLLNDYINVVRCYSSQNLIKM